MTDYKITAEAYEYHYKNGFTGVDAMGWDSGLQYAWSRAGAALTCNIEYKKDRVLSEMSKKYGNPPIIHEINGVSFHHAQSKRIKSFCTKERIDELEMVIPKLERGEFSENNELL
ncbi:hypothetical protein [Sulfuriflexus sp.]|uniref:hypothetical protein n=1 Tax=Sulfuriflexus sp. TaxID=2015443 RepID=UPI0028CF9D22|nr:hypothetical protein [Sulfuriflexus sp.]MDT8403637.1 hypothetical protein [Sulfuriflexus sp.]